MVDMYEFFNMKGSQLSIYIKKTDVFAIWVIFLKSLKIIDIQEVHKVLQQFLN